MQLKGDLHEIKVCVLIYIRKKTTLNELKA